ncbi:hypothetical protein OHA19_10555 [Streptomyces sp. NBC_00012]|uniref:hypothetical protein n=1 Tax=Streptomyces sp. NBC_00012 TaxID=2975621 RepID=UPI00324592DB
MTFEKASENGKPICGAPRTKHGGAPCQLAAGFGTDHPGTGRCRHHLGNTPNHQRAAAKVEADRLLAAVELAEPIDDPHAALARLARSLQATVDAISSRVGTEPTDDKGKGRYEVELWLKVLDQLRQTLTALTRAGVPDVAVTVHQPGIPVTDLFRQLAAVLQPWPDAAAAVADLALTLADPDPETTP